MKPLIIHTLTHPSIRYLIRLISIPKFCYNWEWCGPYFMKVTNVLFHRIRALTDKELHVLEQSVFDSLTA